MSELLDSSSLLSAHNPQRKLWRILDIHFLRAQPPEPGAITALSTLTKLSHNIIQYPTVLKYRKLTAHNAHLLHILNTPGGEELLHMMGFKSLCFEFEQVWRFCGSQEPMPDQLQWLMFMDKEMKKALVQMRQQREDIHSGFKNVVKAEKEAKVLLLKEIESDRERINIRRRSLKMASQSMNTSAHSAVRQSGQADQIEALFRDRKEKIDKERKDAFDVNAVGSRITATTNTGLGRRESQRLSGYSMIHDGEDDYDGYTS